jgi:hypothetical protein
LSPGVEGALGWLAERLQPPGGAVIRGLEQDLAREATLDGAWSRFCETAWTLGFSELRLVPAPDLSEALCERHDFAPRPWPMPEPGNGRPNGQSTWAFGLTSDGRIVATVTAHRRLSRVDFEPQDLVAVLQRLVDRFVGTPAPPAPSLDQ